MEESRRERMEPSAQPTSEIVTPLYRKLDASLLRGAWLVGDCRFCSSPERGQAVWTVGGAPTRRRRRRVSRGPGRRPLGHRRLP